MNEAHIVTLEQVQQFLVGTALIAVGNATVDQILAGATFSTAAGVNLIGTRAPAPVPKTGQTASSAAGDDGDLERGVPWPMPRFTDNGDGTVTDNLTGLIWLKNAGCTDTVDGVMGPAATWANALVFANALADDAGDVNDYGFVTP